MAEENRQWYRSRWVAVTLIIFFPPVGLVLLWAFSPTGALARWGLTAVALFVTGPVLLTAWFASEPLPPIQTQTSQREAAAVPSPAQISEQDTAAAEDVACRADIQCWGDQHSIAAAFSCPDEIERLAQYAHEWTDGIFEPKFSRFRWLDQEAGTITYIGDTIQFQTGLGAFQPHIYECDFDTATDTPLAVRAAPGRL